MPILGRQGRPDLYYSAFFGFVAVAPSQSPKPLPLVDLVDRAREFVQLGFPGVFPDEPEYAGHELVRYRATIEGVPSAQHRIIVYPTGLVELHWVLAAPPTTQLPLLDLVGATRRLHLVVQSSTFPGLHRPRRWERWRRVDWQIGVNGWATPSDGTNSVSWTEINAGGDAPRRRTSDPRPYCPPAGYAADQTRSVRRRVPLDDILTPVLIELFASGGYIGGEEIRDCVSELLTDTRQLEPAELPSKTDSIGEDEQNLPTDKT